MVSEKVNYSTLLGLTEELLTSQSDVKLYVGGNSMYPHLRRGDYVKVAKMPFQYLKIGDIIVFKGYDKFVAHRIIKIIKTTDGCQILPKGDSCNKTDSLIMENKYLGKIISFNRKGRNIDLESSFYKKYNIFLAVISPYTPVVYSFVRFFKHLWRDKKQKASSL